MARFDMSGAEEMIRAMQRMAEDAGPAAEAVLQAGAEGVKRAWQEAAEAHDLRDTGDMIDSIGFSRKPKDAGDGLYIDIYPQGVDRKGVRNATKAFVLHYGTSKMHATRWVDDADKRSERYAIPAMNATWDEFISTGKVPKVALTPNNAGRGGLRTTKN